MRVAGWLAAGIVYDSEVLRKFLSLFLISGP